jgi:Protein of unknown function (DUF3307)
MTAVTLLVAMVAFQAKHLVCDFILQTRYQVDNKGFYGRLGGLAHAGWHILFSIPVLLILTRSAGLIAGLLLFEFLVHYHTDWLKARTQRLRGWTQNDAIYWVAFGADQFVHQVTYLAMVAVVALQPL